MRLAGFDKSVGCVFIFDTGSGTVIVRAGLKIALSVLSEHASFSHAL